MNEKIVYRPSLVLYDIRKVMFTHTLYDRHCRQRESFICNTVVDKIKPLNKSSACSCRSALHLSPWFMVPKSGMIGGDSSLHQNLRLYLVRSSHSVRRDVNTGILFCCRLYIPVDASILLKAFTPIHSCLRIINRSYLA